MKTNDLINYKNKTIYSLGLMSGTSLDGVDIAYVKHENENGNTNHELIAFKTYPYSKELKQKILKNTEIETSRIDEICSLNKELGIVYKNVVEMFLNEFKIKLNKISFISLHGQTIYHIPFGNDKLSRSTLQLGDMSELAYHFNKIIVYDFRSLDVSAGGGGAPLVPIVNFELFKDKAPIMLLNIGGISNLTYIKDDNVANVLAFDSGPGNMVIDRLMLKLYNMPYDEDGKVAQKGKIARALFTTLIDDEYYNKPLPKSTGREKYNNNYVDKIITMMNQHNIPKEDVIYTITYLTAYTINQGIEMFIKNKDVKLLVSGGGANNPTLMNMLKSFNLNVITTDDENNISKDALEAYSFSILGYLRLTYQPANIPSVTGAKDAIMLGSIILPPRKD